MTGTVVVLSTAGQRALRSGVVPGPRGIVARNQGVVSSFLMVWSSFPILTCSLLDESAG